MMFALSHYGKKTCFRTTCRTAPHLPQTGNVDQESESWAKEADSASPYGLIRREGGIWRVLQELNRLRSSQGAMVTLPA
ncbi:MAG: hypothetical protein A2139_12430 [Desulfobacca sp. RBG_16_60_12]|nr:MAG: hypothetical protein A2139_12430 [Desulfobacca sp. RBG_16_60_12]